jgi:hypothetical protein
MYWELEPDPPFFCFAYELYWRRAQRRLCGSKSSLVTPQELRLFAGRGRQSRLRLRLHRAQWLVSIVRCVGAELGDERRRKKLSELSASSIGLVVSHRNRHTWPCAYAISTRVFYGHADAHRRNAVKPL